MQSDTALAEGKERFRIGTQLFDLGKYHEAAIEYEVAFRLTDKAPLLYNCGQAHRLAGETREAIAAYRGFVRRMPDAPQRAEVEANLAELERKLAEGPPLPTVQPSVHPAPLLLATSQPKRNAPVPVVKRWWLWTAVGIVVAGVAVGTGVGVTQSAHTRGTLLAPVTLP